MRFRENGLEITIFPPNGEEIAPGSNSTTKVNIINHQHQLGIKLQVSLNLKAHLQSWCKKHQYSITIGYRQSQEVEFIWNIPIEAVAGIYNYYLNVRFLNSTSFSSFQPKVRQLTVLPTIVAPQINNIEPSFTISPASSSTQPIILSSKDLNLEIDVHNRSNKTDNFRVSTDLELAWYAIRYPEVFENMGVIDGANALNLNPREKGQINLQITPPPGTVAGNYKPEIKLHSLNSPDLFLKKIIYLNILAEHILEAELKNILNRVSHKKGQYNIRLTNKGNTFRKIKLEVRSSDEDECCEYFLSQSLVKIPPDKTVETKLEVQPNSQQKKSFFKAKEFNFQVDLIDSNNYPLPKNLPLKSNLQVRSRPLWQLILLLLLIVGVLGVSAWGIWRLLFYPQPEPKIISFEPEKVEYPYGKSIALEWTLENYQQISSVEIYDKAIEDDRNNRKCYYFNETSPDKDCIQLTTKQESENCNIARTVVSCSDIFPHAKSVKEYTFKLEAKSDRRQPIIEEAKLSILPKPTIKIFEPITVSSTEYKPEEPNSLSFEVSNIDNLVGEDKVFLLINNKRQAEPVITPENISEVCTKSINDRYACTINIPQLSVGEYTLGIELQHDDDGRKNLEPKQFIVSQPIVVQIPIELKYFKINDKDDGTIEEEANTPIIVSWSVTGSNAKVNLDCVGGQLDLQGTTRLNVPEGSSQTCNLEVLDKSGKSIIRKSLTVEVAEPEPPKELELKELESLFDE